MFTSSVSGLGYKQPVYNTSSTSFKGQDKEAVTNVFNTANEDTVQTAEITESNKSKKGGALKVLAGIFGAVALGALAIFAKKGDLFSKVKNALSGAEGSNIIQKIKSVATKGNVQKAAQAIKTGAQETISTVAPKAKNIATSLKGKTRNLGKLAKDKATPAMDALKEKATPVMDAIKEKSSGAFDTMKEKATSILEHVKK